MLIDELERQGQWLFRRRSYVPLLLVPLAVWVISSHESYLAGSEGLDFVYKLTCLVIALAGLAVRVFVHGYALEGSSGRNTKEQVATNLNTTGLYSAVRHPLYLGNIVMVAGILLFTRSLLLTAVGLCGYLLFYERIMATEERFLTGKFGDAYRIWAERTPALLPRRSEWVRPDIPFSWKRAIRAEFYGLLAVVAVMSVLDTLDRWFIERDFRPQPFWLILLCISVTLFVVLRYLRKHTHLLEGTPRKEMSATS